MSKKKSKKGRRKKLPSSPSGSEQETSQVQDATKKHKSPKMKQSGSSLDRPAERQQDGSPTGKHVSQSSPKKERPTKKAVYRLIKTPGSDQKPAEKEEACVKIKSYFSQATSSIAGRGPVVSVGKTPERTLSESLGTHSAGVAPQNVTKTSQGNLQKSLQKSHSKSRQSMSPRPHYVALEEQKRGSMKRPSHHQPSPSLAEKDGKRTQIQQGHSQKSLQKSHSKSRQSMSPRPHYVALEEQKRVSMKRPSPQQPSPSLAEKDSKSTQIQQGNSQKSLQKSHSKSRQSMSPRPHYVALEEQKRGSMKRPSHHQPSPSLAEKDSKSTKIQQGNSQKSLQNSHSKSRQSMSPGPHYVALEEQKRVSMKRPSPQQPSPSLAEKDSKSIEIQQGNSLKSLQKSHSKSRQSMIPRSVYVALEEQKRVSMKRPSPKQPSPSLPEKDSKSIDIQKERREERRRLAWRRCQDREEVVMAKRNLCAEAQLSSAASPVEKLQLSSAASPVESKSSTSAINSASQTSSNLSEHLTQKQGNATLLSREVKSPSTQVEITLTKPAVPISFKIQKKTRPVLHNTAIRKDDKNTNFSANAKTEIPSTVSHIRRTECTGTESSVKRAQEGPVPDVLCSAVISSTPQLERKGNESTVSGQSVTLPCNNTLPWTVQVANTSPWIAQALVEGDGPSVSTQIYRSDEEMQLVEVLHQVRSANSLEIDLVESYGELTGMDIDSPVDTHSPLSLLSSASPPQQLFVVLDTNILLSHLRYVRNIVSHGLGALGFPVVLIPWVVLQELDSLKDGKSWLCGSVSHLAAPAVHYIYSCLKSQEPRLWGQSMQQAAQSNYGLNAENSDDRVLQCCLQYQHLHPGGAVILCTNDKNLCSKAMLSGVRAFSKVDLEAEVDGYISGLPFPLLTGNPAPWFHTNAPTCDQTQNKGRSIICPGPQGNEMCLNWRRVNEGMTEDKERRLELTNCVSALEDCLKEALSVILEEEMKAAFEDFWKDIVIVKPPWTLRDILLCFKKHWIAVFGDVIPRNHAQTVQHLSDFLHSGKTVDVSSMVTAICHAQELLQAFGRRSHYGGRVPSALSSLDGLTQKLLPQSERVKECPLRDAVMCEDDQKLPAPPGVSQEEVWALFEDIWRRVVNCRSSVFTALGVDSSTLQISQSEGGPPPPQDALACLYKLISMVTQLLQAFFRVLSPDSGLEESQELLSFIRSNEIVAMETRCCAKDLLECFSQQEYREKLRIGGCQLTEVNVSLEHCAEAVGRRVTHAALL